VVLKEHGVGNQGLAQPYLDRMVAIAAKINGWPGGANGKYFTNRASAAAFIKSAKPHYGILSLPAFLAMRKPYQLDVIGRVSVSLAGGRRYFLISKKADSIDACKGQTLATDHGDDPRLIDAGPGFAHGAGGIRCVEAEQLVEDDAREAGGGEERGREERVRDVADEGGAGGHHRRNGLTRRRDLRLAAARRAGARHSSATSMPCAATKARAHAAKWASMISPAATKRTTSPSWPAMTDSRLTRLGLLALAALPACMTVRAPTHPELATVAAQGTSLGLSDALETLIASGKDTSTDRACALQVVR
jgi:hypothetical protein